MTSLEANSESSKKAAVVFAARESPTLLLQTLKSIDVAGDERTTVDLLVNGRLELAEATVQLLKNRAKGIHGRRIRVWYIPLADKANALNQYVHRIWSGETIVYFVDGYARPRPNALACLERCMLIASEALACAGVPTVGHGAAALRKEMLEWGGLHGNLFCMRGQVIKEMRAYGVRLPTGHYRTDGLLASILYFGLNPAAMGWDFSRIATCEGATWDTNQRRWWHPTDILDAFRRRIRQARGVLEYASVRELLDTRRRPIVELPETSSQLILNWIERCPEEAQTILTRSPIVAYVFWRIRNELMPFKADPSVHLLEVVGAPPLSEVPSVKNEISAE